jgi:hypothetical protein
MQLKHKPDPLAKQLADALQQWIKATQLDQGIDERHAAEVVLAKIRAKIIGTKRQYIDFRRHFTVCTTYFKNGLFDTHFCDWPQVVADDKGIRTGCITFSNEAILEMVRLLALQLKKTELTVVQEGYMKETK